MGVVLRREIAASVVRRALRGVDHRELVVDLIDGAFVSEAIDFFKQIVSAKMERESITLEWYKSHFLDKDLDKAELANNAGLNIKTITNKRQTARKEVVIEESLAHLDKFVDLINTLDDDSVNIDLSLTFREVTVRLNLNESLVVINALAVKWASLRGGAWSAVGKQVEGPLMEALCRLFQVDERHFTRSITDDESLREVDYYLLPPSGERLKCEVKLMGKGNPESADAVLARSSKIFVASVLSDLNKKQLQDRGIYWTELQTANGFLRFKETLKSVGIPYIDLAEKSDYSRDIDRAVQLTFRGVAENASIAD